MEVPEAVYPFDNSVSEGSGFELNFHKLSCERPCAEDELRTSTNMTENAVNKAQQASYGCSVIKNDNVVDEEVGDDETFHLQISHEQHAGHDPTSEADKVSNSEDIRLYKEFILPDVRMQKCLIKSATFPSAEVDSLSFFNPGINGPSSSSSAPVQNSSSDQLPTYKRSTSFPAFSKLVSAMKGGRTQNGTSSPRIDMRVKWAEDVYDPPATSMSHTVKSYNIQRPKYKKKDNHRQKHNKGKNSRGNNSGKKLPNRGNVGSISAPFPAKLQTGGAIGPAKQSEDILEFGVGGLHDTKCGSSIFLRESLAKVHISFGLSRLTTDEKLKDAFSPFGQLLEAKVITDRVSGRSKGFGFVSYATIEEADKARYAMNAKFLDGWVIFVDPAKPKERRPLTTSPEPEASETGFRSNKTIGWCG